MRGSESLVARSSHGCPVPLAAGESSRDQSLVTSSRVWDRYRRPPASRRRGSRGRGCGGAGVRRSVCVSELVMPAAADTD